jgi:flagellar hook-basal body complex protein FliE
MNVLPLSSISSLSEYQKLQSAYKAPDDNGSFKGMLNDLIANVNETDRISKEDIVKMATGDADDLHTVMINSEKAELSTLMLVQVRNKILDAYNEIMRVNL